MMLFPVLKKGSKIKFVSEKQMYTVRAANSKFAICTKHYNPKRTVIYTVIDWERNVRGTEGQVFCRGAETDMQCRLMLGRLTSGRTFVSYRNFVTLEIEDMVNLEIE